MKVTKDEGWFSESDMKIELKWNPYPSDVLEPYLNNLLYNASAG